jgi:hypothetical protein
VVWLAALLRPGTGTGAEPEVVRALFEQHCWSCHSHSAEKLKANLFLDSRGGLLQGGDSGPVLVSGDPDRSLLIRAVRYDTVDLRMPPTTKLAMTNALLEDWVRQGASWPANQRCRLPSIVARQFDLEERRRSHWAWQPVQKTNRLKFDAVGLPSRPTASSSPNWRAVCVPPRGDRRTLARRLVPADQSARPDAVRTLWTIARKGL